MGLFLRDPKTGRMAREKVVLTGMSEVSEVGQGT